MTSLASIRPPANQQQVQEQFIQLQNHHGFNLHFIIYFVPLSYFSGSNDGSYQHMKPEAYPSSTLSPYPAATATTLSDHQANILSQVLEL